MGPLAFLGDLWTHATLSDPDGPLRLACEDELRCGELLFAGGFRHAAGASVLTIVRCLSASRRLGAAAGH